MAQMPDGCVDLVFADPPFNLRKNYGEYEDNLPLEDYMGWSQKWMGETNRILIQGGQAWIHQIPFNAIYYAYFALEDAGFDFQNWVALRFESWVSSYNLNPFHYVLLRISKGQPRTFNRDGDFEPHAICPHCFRYIADWGGKENQRDSRGKHLSDIWTDIERLRHPSLKTRGANELPAKLIERCLLLTSTEGDLIFDPFIGSGTTAVVADRLGRKFFGCDINPDYVEMALERLEKDRAGRQLVLL